MDPCHLYQPCQHNSTCVSKGHDDYSCTSCTGCHRGDNCDSGGSYIATGSAWYWFFGTLLVVLALFMFAVTCSLAESVFRHLVVVLWMLATIVWLIYWIWFALCFFEKYTLVVDRIVFADRFAALGCR